MNEQIKKSIIDLLLSTGRVGMSKLIEHMEQAGYFTATCSSQYHLAQEGGLAEHSLNVCQVMVWTWQANPCDGITKEAIIITSLLHDLGKMGQYGKPGYVANTLKSGKISDSKPYTVNKDLLPVDHEIRSVAIAQQYIQLTEQEAYAILHHNGMYGNLKYALSGNETPLQMLLHFADMWASRVVEV